VNSAAGFRLLAARAWAEAGLLEQEENSANAASASNAR
jgi:hypothetical protein